MQSHVRNLSASNACMAFQSERQHHSAIIAHTEKGLGPGIECYHFILFMDTEMVHGKRNRVRRKTSGNEHRVNLQSKFVRRCGRIGKFSMEMHLFQEDSRINRIHAIRIYNLRGSRKADFVHCYRRQ